MKKLLRAIGDAVIMGLIWAFIWGLLGVLTGTITESLTGSSLEKHHIDPLAALAMPGFLCGVIFFTVLWFAKSGCRISELTISRVGAWGVIFGLLLGPLAFALGTPTDRFTLRLVIVMIVGSSILLSTFSAIGSALFFRFFARHKILVFDEPER